MKAFNSLTIGSLSLLLLTSCGFYKDYDGHRVDVKIAEADVEKGRPNAIASMVLIYTPSPVTRYKDVFLKVAAQESGCIPLEETLAMGGVAGHVELDCG
jgi:hypothetical protein